MAEEAPKLSVVPDKLSTLLNLEGMARDLAGAEGVISACYILEHESGGIKWDMSGFKRKDLLWALERMKAEVLDV